MCLYLRVAHQGLGVGGWGLGLGVGGWGLGVGGCGLGLRDGGQGFVRVTGFSGCRGSR